MYTYYCIVLVNVKALVCAHARGLKCSRECELLLLYTAVLIIRLRVWPWPSEKKDRDVMKYTGSIMIMNFLEFR